MRCLDIIICVVSIMFVGMSDRQYLTQSASLTDEVPNDTVEALQEVYARSKQSSQQQELKA